MGGGSVAGDAVFSLGSLDMPDHKIRLPGTSGKPWSLFSPSCFPPFLLLYLINSPRLSQQINPLLTSAHSWVQLENPEGPSLRLPAFDVDSVAFVPGTPTLLTLCSPAAAELR